MMKIFLLLILCYLWFLNAACRAIVPSLLPLIEDEFHLSHALAGSLAGSLAAGYTLTLSSAALKSALKRGTNDFTFTSAACASCVTPG